MITRKDAIEVLDVFHKAMNPERARECDCPVIKDPYGTGDTWLEEQSCLNPFNCPHTPQADDEEEESDE